MTITKTESDTTPVATDNNEATVHQWCTACYPDGLTFGMRALCGEKLLGVKPTPEAPRCNVCKNPTVFATHKFEIHGLK